MFYHKVSSLLLNHRASQKDRKADQSHLGAEQTAAALKASWENPVPSFEEQFAQREPGATVAAIDVRPAVQKSPAPVLFVPGWSETPHVLEKCIRGLFNAQRRVLSLTLSLAAEQTGSGEPPPATQERYVAELVMLLDEKGIDQPVDIIAHSGGAKSAVELASQYPQRVRNVVLLNPGGLIGAKTTSDLLGRVASHLTQSGLHPLANPPATKEVMRGGNAAGKYLFTHPVKAVQEARAISQAKIHNTLSSLHEKGIGIAVVAGEDDKLFPAQEIRGIVPTPEEETPYATLPNKTTEVDAVLSIPGIHNELYIRPDNFMQGADKLLTILEQKRVTRQSFTAQKQEISANCALTIQTPSDFALNSPPAQF